MRPAIFSTATAAYSAPRRIHFSDQLYFAAELVFATR